VVGAIHFILVKHEFYRLITIFIVVATNPNSLLQAITTIPFSELKMSGKPMASGSFKSVYKATWARPGHPVEVAVLVLRQGGSLAEEIEIFERLGQHPHLVKLLAVSSRPPSGDICMVCEFAQKGSLDCVLQELAEKGENNANTVLLTAALQVCMQLLFC
jgi:serine/threonine protein kinase